MAKLFDPLGFVSPFVLRAKILLKELWTQGIEWDDPIAAETHRHAENWLNELEDLQTVKIPRCLLNSSDVKSVTVHTFVEASKDAFSRQLP